MTKETELDLYVYPGKRFARNGLRLGDGQGMSLRDYFAGQALAGIAGPKGDGFSLQEGDAAHWAYQYADAMLAEREKPE